MTGRVRPSLVAGVTAGTLLFAAASLHGQSNETTEGGAIDPASFRFIREIATSGPGLHVVTLDPAALAHSRLVDLRIVSQGRRQVPFLLEQCDEPLSLQLPALEPATATRNELHSLPAQKGGRSFYRVRFPYAGLSLARFVLATSARVFDRDVRVIVDDPATESRRAPMVVAARWVHASPDTAAPPAMFDLGSLGGDSALVVVDEGDNSPLPLDPPRLLLSAYRVRFFSQSDTPLTLVYGHRTLEAPHYDLKLLSASLTGATAAEATLGPERTQQEPSGFVSAVALFWSVLVVAVIVLLTLIVRLLGKNSAAS